MTPGRHRVFLPLKGRSPADPREADPYLSFGSQAARIGRAGSGKPSIAIDPPRYRRNLVLGRLKMMELVSSPALGSSLNPLLVEGVWK